MVSEAQKAQRERALQKANRVRYVRAEIKEQLHDRRLTLEELLADPPAEVLNAPIGEVLEWLPGIGRWRANRILAPGVGSPAVGRLVEIQHLSVASKARIVVRYDKIKPGRYPQAQGEAIAA